VRLARELIIIKTLRSKIAELKAQGQSILLAGRRVDFALALARPLAIFEPASGRSPRPSIATRRSGRSTAQPGTALCFEHRRHPTPRPAGM